jgi:hypothetical protein
MPLTRTRRCSHNIGFEGKPSMRGLMQHSMKRTLITIAVLGTAQPALAQWGLFGFAADGLVYQIDEFTGETTFMGDSGLKIVDVANPYSFYDPWTALVLTEDDRLVRVHLRSMEVSLISKVTGRPSGAVPVAYNGEFAVLRTSAGDDVLYQIGWPVTAYTEIGPTGLRDVSGMVSGQICTVSGSVYGFNQSTGQTIFGWGVNNGDALDSISRSDCGTYVTGQGLYRLKHGMTQPVQIRSTGFEGITALTYASAFQYACEYDYGQFSICDIFDFLAFQNDFVVGASMACDCDISTGVGVCDVFDFLCFQNAWVEGTRIKSKCR